LRSRGMVPSGNDQRELVAADARDEMITRRLLQPPGYLLQQDVACRMPVDVVGLLEAVEIDAQDRERIVARRRFFERDFNACIEGRAIWQLRQRIVMRHVADT